MLVVAHRPAPIGPASHHAAVRAEGRTQAAVMRRPRRSHRRLRAVAGPARRLRGRAELSVRPSRRPARTRRWSRSIPPSRPPPQPPDDWWRLYDDPELDRLVQQAFAANADLAVAQANLSAARASLEAARNGLYPQTDANVGGRLWPRCRHRRDPRDRRPRAADHLAVRRRPRRLLRTRPVRPRPPLDRGVAGRRRGRRRRARQRQDHRRRRDHARLRPGLRPGRADRRRAPLARRRQPRSGDHSSSGHDAGAGSEFDVVRAQEVWSPRSAPPSRRSRASGARRCSSSPPCSAARPSQAPLEVETCVDAAAPGRADPGRRRREPAETPAGRAPGRPAAGGGHGPHRRRDRRSLSADQPDRPLRRRGVQPERPGRRARPDLGRRSRASAGPFRTWPAPRARIHQAKAGAAAALAGFDSTVLQALKETEQSLATYSAELDHRAGAGRRPGQGAAGLRHGARPVPGRLDQHAGSADHRADAGRRRRRGRRLRRRPGAGPDRACSRRWAAAGAASPDDHAAAIWRPI